ncbi:MAG: hypothetical protein LBU34_00175 [Planctomycetaceae bacterium]|nr:hypothetical protein [Planctomycetaceae bacterium]
MDINPPRCGGLYSIALAGRRTSRLTPNCIFLVVGKPTTRRFGETPSTL